MSEDNTKLEAEIQRLKEEHRREISAISHEIRNPLTLIDSSLQLVELSCPQVRSHKFWSYIKEDLAHLRLLLDDISSFQSAGQLVRLAPCDLSALLKDLVYAFLPELNRRRIRLDAQGIQAGITADGDAVRLKQAWMNLIKNAAEALDDGGLIRLSLCREKESAVLTVADNGPGIPAQEADAIFLPYHTTKEHGTGLGLPIAREIAQAHGGSLTCRSSGDGTAFTFSLPLHSRLPGQPL